MHRVYSRWLSRRREHSKSRHQLIKYLTDLQIVILSLVRSNKKGSIGFVKIVNRIIVSLSRAKCGLYILGNKDFLTNLSDKWLSVVRHLEKRNCCGEVLILQCPNHPSTRTEIKKVSEIPSNFLLVFLFFYKMHRLPTSIKFNTEDVLCHVLLNSR